MVDYLQEINNGLIIEEPKILLPWSLQKKDVFDKINCIQENLIGKLISAF